MIARLRSFARSFARDRRGVGAFELALVLPVVLGLVVGTVEVGNYYLLHQNLNSAASQVGNLVTQEEKFTAAQLRQMLSAAQHLVDRDDFGRKGVVIVTAITAQSNGAKKISWQVKGGGSLNQNSKWGNPGGVVTELSSFTMSAGETVIAIELFYDYGGSSMGMVPTKLIRKVALSRARTGDLSALSTS